MMMEQRYRKQIERLEKQKKELKKGSRYYLLAKLTSFSVAATFVYFSYSSPSAGNICCIFIFALLYILFCILDSHCMNKIQSLNARISVCNHEIEYLNGDFTAFDDGSRYINPKHEYAYDLDIFGRNSLFHRINRTITERGNKLLAERLSNPTLDREEIERNKEAVQELKTMNDWRIKFMSNPRTEGIMDHLADQKENGKVLHLLFTSSIPYILVLVTITVLILCSLDQLPWKAFTSLFLLQFFISIIIGKTTSIASTRTEQLHKEYKTYLILLNDIHQMEVRSEKLRNIKDNLFSKGNNSLLAFRELAKILHLFDQRNNIILYILLNGIVLFDLMLIRRFISWNKRYSTHVKVWLSSIAEIDALASLGTYAYNNPTNNYAETLDETSSDIIEATDVYHPFLHHDKAVPNSFTLREKNISIITGANMAGKSTFLRTIGITYILASNGVPVCAKSFKFRTVTLFSSMRNSDDLANDISYFNAELLRLKQLLQHVKTHSYTLIILDEILKGTNSKDKLKGSIMFLNEISRHNISAIIATHDLELSKLETEDKNIYTNYCFEIELSAEIKYTYKIQKGVAQNLNASYLLANILEDMEE